MNKLVRWLPAIVAPALVAAAVAIPTIASADPPLPAKTPQQVLELVASSADAAYSGTVNESSNLGLPDLSALSSLGGGSADSDSPYSLLTWLVAPHTAQVFVDGVARQRVQVLGDFAETDVIRNGDEVWLYDSSDKTASHGTLTTASEASEPSAGDVTPATVTAELVKALAPSTSLTVSTTRRVAGRPVYALTLTPKTTATLIGHVTLAVDASTGVPLSATIYGRGQTKPAGSIAFSSISYGAPAASVFDFTAPAGTTVTPLTSDSLLPGASGLPSALPGVTGEPQVLGSDWTSIVELPAGTATALTELGATTVTTGAQVGSGAVTSVSSSGDSSGLDVSGLIDSLTTAVPGGRAVQTALFSILITNDGRILAGAVPVSSLEAAAR